MDTLVRVIIGAGVGWVTGQLLLVFFTDEIFSGIDSAVERVRKFFNLPT